MKIVKLLSKSSVKILRGEKELSINDVEELPRGTIPGEWLCLVLSDYQKKYLAYVNTFAEIFFKIKIVREIEWTKDISENESVVAQEIIISLLNAAIKRRELFKGYESGCRLIYGGNDSLPGLIVDKYQKYILIQINTAGIDRFRDLIKTQIESKFKDYRVLYFDNVEYRKAEVLPLHEKEEFNDDLDILENGLYYKIPKNNLQKIGYYYDHRENRERLRNLLLKLNLKMDKGLDLFSYVGSWGLHLLSAGVGHVDFVDQANMEDVVLANLKHNNLEGRGSFFRSDVFKFLDQKKESDEFYDVIVSDPPAFTKSEKNKNTAIAGYEKLHLKAMRLLNERAIFVAASCTHYVDFFELDKTVQDAAIKNNQTLQFLEMGNQGFDHPMKSLKDKSFYIKYIVYYVYRGNHE